MAKWGGVRYVDFVMMTEDGGHPQPPTKKYPGDAGWDLFASRPITIPPGDTMDVHTDIRMRMPERVFARIIGRSSTLRTHRLLVSEAIIDNDYTGEMFISVHNIGSEPFEVETGMRLAQVIFHMIEDIRWSEIEAYQFRPGRRGDRGFGSTGMFKIE